MYQRANQNRFQIFSTLVLPIAIGLGLYILLGLMIDKEFVTNELLLRYLVGHPISKCTTLLFLIGVSALLLIGNNVFDQFCSYNKISLDLKESEEPRSKKAKSAKPRSISDKADGLIQQLQQFDWSQKKQYLWQRLVGALSFVKRTNSTAGIEDELKYLADIDRDRKHHRYALIRILIWATPMLGFLGTVLGISEALGGIQVGADNDFQQMLSSLRSSLFVAFDTTALALTLSIVMMFLQFFTDRFESQLLDIVDRRTHEELSPIYGNHSPVDPQTNVASAEAMHEVGEVLLAGAQEMLELQSEQWKAHLESTESVLDRKVNGFSDAVKNELCHSIGDASSGLADAMNEMTQCVNEQMSQGFCDWQQLLEQNATQMSERWNQWQVTLSDNARQIAQSQELVSEQLHLTREVLDELAAVQNKLRDLSRLK